MTARANKTDIRVLIIGVGSPDRGDDGAGVAAARLMRAAALAHIHIVEHSGEASGLIDLWQTARAPVVYLIDAMASGATPGTIARFDAHRQPLPAHFGSGTTHDFGVVQAVELARILGMLPPQVIVFGVEGARFDAGAALSDDVAAAIPLLVAQILAEISAPGQ